MLVRSNTTKYIEDYGIMTPNGVVHLFENGTTKLSECKPVNRVLRVNAFWVKKDIKIRCSIADTPLKKRIGLQKHTKLDKNYGMYFPYIPYTDVTFHQGSVPFSLDLIFLRDNCIEKIVSKTKIGSKSKWGYKECDGVIELNGGYCNFNNIECGDEVDFFAITQEDIYNFNNEQNTRAVERATTILTEISNRMTDE